MGVYDKSAVLQEVRRLLPDVQAIAVTGSAAFEGKHFQPASDIDVVATHPKNGFAWSQVAGRDLEIHALSIERIKWQVQNPQYHGPSWVWNVGKIGGAELLCGPSLEALVRSQITKKTRLIAGSALIGFLLMAENKAKLGRRPASLDVPLALTALRRVVSGALPIRAEADQDLEEFSAMSDFSKEFENATKLGEECLNILAENSELQGITYFPAHRTGLRWLRKALSIDLEMPQMCLLG